MEQHKATILVVDDDEAIRTLLCRALGARYDVVGARDATAAFAALAQVGMPDLIICDVMMPGMNGLDFIKRVRGANPETKPTVIFLTAKDQPLDVVAGINVGARSYVTKPFKLDALLARVERIVGQP